MRLGNLTQKEIKSCGFYQYGTKIEKQPAVTETAEANPWGWGGVSWKWNQVMDMGVDAEIVLEKDFFVDHVSVRFEQGKAPAHVTFLLDGEAVWGRQSGESLLFTVAETCGAVTLRMQGSLGEIVLEKLEIAACLDEEAGVYPIPRHTEMKSGRILRADLGKVQYEENEDGQELAASMLTGKAAGLLGVSLTGNIPIVLKKESCVESESFCIRVSEEQVTVTAGGRRGFLYGVSKLLQMLLREEIPCCEIEDKPFKELRGFHMGLPPREEFGFYKRFIRDLLVPMGYNTLFLQVTAGMRFKKHPEINEAWVDACKKSNAGEWPTLHHSDMIAGGEVLEQEEVAELTEYARMYGLEVIPEIQSLGHVQYMTLAHPELAEVDPDDHSREEFKDERIADQPPRTFYKHSYCPSNEDSYKLLFDLMDEILEVMKPSRYVHMGHDEVYQIGVCPKCKNSSPSELFAGDVRRIHDYLKERGLGMMIWSDMIQPDSGYETTGAIDLLPKDVVMLDFIWYFHLDQDLEDYLLEKGYTVAVGNLYSSHYPRYESRIRKERMLGGQVSTWCRPDEYVLGREGKLYDLLFTAGMLWTESYDSAYRETYNRMITGLLPWVRSELHGQGLTPSLKKGAVETELVREKGERTRRSSLIAYDFAEKEFGQACQISQEHPAEYNGGNEVWESLAFYHASLLHEGRTAYGPLKKIGCCTIEFADGSRESVDVEYGGNIGCIDFRYGRPLPQAYYRHTGYTAAYFADPVEGRTAGGMDQTLYRLEWVNVNRKAVKKICYEGEACGGILLAGIRGVKAN